MWNKNYNKISNYNPKYYFRYLFIWIVWIISVIHLNAIVVFPLNGYNAQCTEVQSFGCVSYPKHSVQKALIATERVNPTFFSLPDFVLIVCFVAILVIPYLSKRMWNFIYYNIRNNWGFVKGLAREIFSHPKSLFLLKLGHIDVSYCFYWS